MNPSTGTWDLLAEEFASHRSHLTAVAYRLTGTLSDAEDAVQDAWLRLSGLTAPQRAEIRDLKAWSTTVTSRICLDKLQSAPARREHYVGQWLPEPIVTRPGTPDPLDHVVLDDGVRMAAMIVLDRLSPEQRVAFVLHDAFSLPFAEIADILGCSSDAARQHGSRGRRALADADPPPRTALAEQQRVLDRFVTALLGGDIKAVTELLHPDVVLIGDSDGKARTARQIVVGSEKLVRFLFGLLRMYSPNALAGGVTVLVNGDPGVYLPPTTGTDEHRALDAHVQAVSVRDGRIVAIYDLANPDKLRVP
ncbi:MAG: rpoE [Amycolatopsis sp.]|jgi:RNA polymerase sigma-70 factor (ECF subfamily)|uniref:sigma-70 family RNA polymerase sigma factor n=1 Tax=Amycolatopsis sp. TaxID=37632 RepID=UPI0026116390|nr:sigma-70 family RNA polymerase sigma factor [Amycolatopsis sp.]MCU1682284.1 rpoE [Amycolatopsis sp.]